MDDGQLECAVGCDVSDVDSHGDNSYPTELQLEFVVPANSLVAGSLHTFSLSCGGVASSLQVLINTPPSNGSFSVSPQTGFEIKTPFQFTTSLWMDADLPLSWQFGFASSTGNLLIQEKSSSTSGESSLPAGLRSAGFKVVCFVQVFDRLNAFSFKHSRVVVNKVDVAEIASLMSSKHAANSTTSQITQTISVISSALNNVNCLNSPDCVSLNRHNCSTVRDTCGSCYPSFIGEGGSHNSQCTSVGNIQVGVVVGGSVLCSKDSECTNLRVCDQGTRKCVSPPKACPNLCSSSGNCTFVNKNTGSEVSQCFVTSSDCSAVCRCSRGYGGVDCSLTTEELQLKQSIRHQLLVQLSLMTSSSINNNNNNVNVNSSNNKVTASTVESWMSSLSSLTQSPSEISQQSSSVMTSVIDAILSHSLLLGGSYGNIDSILDSINTAAELSRDQTGSSTSLKSQLQQYSSLVGNQLVVGQSSVEKIQSSFRTSVSVLDTSSLQNVTVSSPLSLLEKALSSHQPNSVNIISNGMATSDKTSAVKLSVTEVASKFYGNMSQSFTSNSMDIQISGFNINSRGNGNVSSQVLVTLYNVGRGQRLDVVPANFTTVCKGGKRLNGEYNFTCPESGFFLQHNCTHRNGVYVSYCPVMRPACHVIDSSSNVNNCKVVEFSSTFTKCSCSFLFSQERRSLSSGDSNDVLQSSGVLSIASMSEYVGSEFVDSFAASGDFLTAKGLENSLTLILMFVVIWVGGVGLIVTCAWRRRRMLSRNEKDQEHLKRRAQSAKISRSPAAIFGSLQLYISEIFPSVFSSESRISRMVSEIKKHHRYLNIFTAAPGVVGDRSRFLTGIQLLTVQTLLIFLLSLFYDLQGPDNDGTCVSFNSENSCLARKSYLDPSQTYCLWTAPSPDTTADSQYPCNFQDPSFSFQIVAYIAIMVALITALLLKPIDMIFDYLSAPLADSAKVRAAESTMKKVGRRISNAAGRLSVSIANGAESLATKLRRERSKAVVAGTKTRVIPSSTQSAQLMAHSSMSLVAPIADRRIKWQEAQKLSLKKEMRRGSSNKLIKEETDEVNDEEEDNKQIAGKVALTTASDVSKVSITSLSVDEAFLSLSSDISHQRQVLKPSEIDLFDNQWGIDPTGEFSRDDRHMTILCRKGAHRDAMLNIKSEIKAVQAKASERVEKLNFATDEHMGLEIMHLFILDLLGRETPAARIFEVKLNEDFRHTRVVTTRTRVVCYCLLVLMNGFFMYYSVLRGYLKGLQYQNLFLMACVSQMLVEILLFETIECVWIQFVVPNMVSEEVQRVNLLLSDTVAELCVSDNKLEEKRIVLNAPEYLFVSTNVAKNFPTAMESLIVLSYQSYLPGEISRKWQLGATARIQRRNSLQHTTLFSTTMVTLQVLATLPFLFQRMFIRVSQPFVLLGLVYFGTLIADNVIYTVVASLVTALLAVYLIFLYVRSRNNNNKPKINPIMPSQEVTKVVSNSHEDDEIVFVENMHEDIDKDDKSQLSALSKISFDDNNNRLAKSHQSSCNDESIGDDFYFSSDDSIKTISYNNNNTNSINVSSMTSTGIGKLNISSDEYSESVISQNEVQLTDHSSLSFSSQIDSISE